MDFIRPTYDPTTDPGINKGLLDSGTFNYQLDNQANVPIEPGRVTHYGPGDISGSVLKDVIKFRISKIMENTVEWIDYLVSYIVPGETYMFVQRENNDSIVAGTQAFWYKINNLTINPGANDITLDVIPSDIPNHIPPDGTGAWIDEERVIIKFSNNPLPVEIPDELYGTTLFQLTNFGGDSLTLGIGKYRLSEISLDMIHSWKLNPAHKLIIYSDTEWDVDEMVFKQNTNAFTLYNIQSFIIKSRKNIEDLCNVEIDTYDNVADPPLRYMLEYNKADGVWNMVLNKAQDTYYDSSNNNIIAEDVQGAIDELVERDFLVNEVKFYSEVDFGGQEWIASPQVFVTYFYNPTGSLILTEEHMPFRPKSAKVGGLEVYFFKGYIEFQGVTYPSNPIYESGTTTKFALGSGFHPDLNALNTTDLISDTTMCLTLRLQNVSTQGLSDVVYQVHNQYENLAALIYFTSSSAYRHTRILDDYIKLSGNKELPDGTLHTDQSALNTEVIARIKELICAQDNILAVLHDVFGIDASCNAPGPFNPRPDYMQYQFAFNGDINTGSWKTLQIDGTDLGVNLGRGGTVKKISWIFNKNGGTGDVSVRLRKDYNVTSTVVTRNVTSANLWKQTNNVDESYNANQWLTVQCRPYNNIVVNKIVVSIIFASY